MTTIDEIDHPVISIEVDGETQRVYSLMQVAQITDLSQSYVAHMVSGGENISVDLIEGEDFVRPSGMKITLITESGLTKIQNR